MKVAKKFTIKPASELTAGELCILQEGDVSKPAICIRAVEDTDSKLLVLFGQNGMPSMDRLVANGDVLSLGTDWTVRLPVLPQSISSDLPVAAPIGALFIGHDTAILRVERMRNQARSENVYIDLGNFATRPSTKSGTFAEYHSWSIWLGDEGPLVLGTQPILNVKVSIAVTGFLSP